MKVYYKQGINIELDNIKTEKVDERGDWVVKQLEGLTNAEKRARVAELWDEGVITARSNGVAQYIEDEHNINVWTGKKSKGKSKSQKAADKKLSAIDKEIVKGAPTPKGIDTLIKGLSKKSRKTPISVKRSKIDTQIKAGSNAGKGSTVPNLKSLFANKRVPGPSVAKARDLFVRGGSPSAGGFKFSRSSYRPRA